MLYQLLVIDFSWTKRLLKDSTSCRLEDQNQNPCEILRDLNDICWAHVGLVQHAEYVLSSRFPSGAQSPATAFGLPYKSGVPEVNNH